MTAWPPGTLDAIAATDDLHIAPFRTDGSTYGTLTWIWSVVVDGELYVRGYNGRASRWYQVAPRAGRDSDGWNHAALITAALSLLGALTALLVRDRPGPPV